MNNRSQTTQVNDLVFPLLFALLGLWIYFLYPSDCFNNDTGVSSIIQPTSKESVVTSMDTPEVPKEKEWSYSDRLELVKAGPYSAGEEIEFVYNDREIPEKIIWEVDELVVKISKEQNAVLSHTFDQAGTYLIAAKNPALYTIDTLLLQVTALDETKIIGNKIANYSSSQKTNNFHSQSNVNNTSIVNHSDNETRFSEYQEFKSPDPRPAETIIKKDHIETAIVVNEYTSKGISGQNETRNAEVIIEPFSDLAFDNSVVEPIQPEVTDVPLSENNVDSKTSEEKVVVEPLEEMIDEEEEDLEAADMPEETPAETPQIERKKFVQIYTPEYLKEQNISFLEEINLETLLRAIAKRGNQIEDQKIEDEAQYAIEKITNNLAADKIVLRQKVIINQKEEYLGSATTMQDLFDLLYLRKNRRENVIKDINVTDIIYNEQGYIEGFSYNIFK